MNSQHRHLVQINNTNEIMCTSHHVHHSFWISVHEKRRCWRATIISCPRINHGSVQMSSNAQHLYFDLSECIKHTWQLVDVDYVH
jgi:hypothetical protein